MKRDHAKKKLALDRTTVRTLSFEQLQGVAGGQTLAQCSTICSEDICPDTQFIHGCNSHTIHC